MMYVFFISNPDLLISFCVTCLSFCFFTAAQAQAQAEAEAAAMAAAEAQTQQL